MSDVTILRFNIHAVTSAKYMPTSQQNAPAPRVLVTSKQIRLSVNAGYASTSKLANKPQYYYNAIMKRDPIMQYPYNNSPLTWVVCVLAAIILGIFAFTAFATAVQEHNIIAVVVGLALSYTTYYFSVQAYMWYRYRHAAKEPYLRHAKS